MAFGRNVSKEFTRIIILILFASPVISANINCDGKAFHCVNSTHFMICVDLGGGVLSALDSFVIPCPLSTECRKTNYYECEFPKPVKLETMNKSVVNVLAPVIEPTTISTETSASSPKDLSSYTTGSSNPSITVLPEVSNNVYVDKSDLPQESIGNNVPITTESFKSLLDTATENETTLGRNSFDDTISPNKADTVQVSTVSRELNQTFQDLVDINVSSTIDYKTAVNTSNIRKTQTFEILNDTMKLTSTDIFQMPAKTLINSISNLNTKTALVQENTTSSPLSTTGYFETRTENRVPNKPLYPSKKNTTMQNKIENVQTSTDTNLLNISDNFQGLTGISENTLSSNVINKTAHFYQAPTNKSVSHKHEYLIYPDTISNTTESNQTPTDISTTTKTELLNDGLPIDTILLNSDNFQGPGGTSHLPPAEDVNKQNYTQTYQLELDANINNKTDIFNASSSSKLKSLQELVTTNLQSTKEYFQSTTDTSASFDTQLHKIKYTITDNKTELLEVTDNISRTMGYIHMSTDSSMFIARDQIDVDIINENNKYVTNSTSIINELQYTDFHPSNASAVTNVDNIVENNLNNYLQNNSDIVFNQNNTAEVFVKNTTDVHNKDKALNKVTNNNSTLYDITNYSNLSQVMITINDIVTNTYKDININTATKIEEFDTPTTENSRNQEIITENDFMPNKRNMGTTDAVSRNTMPPLELQSDVDLSTTHLTLFSAPPTLLEIASNTENSNRVEERHLEHTTSYVTATNSMYDDIKYTAQLANTNDNIPTINNNVNNRIVNRTRKFDNFDEFKLEPVNILNNTNNIKLKNITTAAVPQTSYTTELYISEISILNDSVINQTYYPTSVSGLTEIAQNSELQTTTPNTYIYSTTEYVENGNQLVFPETITTSTPTLSSNIKNEYKDVLNIKQTHAENSYNLYSNTNGSPITEPVTSQIELDNHSLFDNTNTTKQELNKTDTKHTHVTSDHIEIKYQSLNKQKVSELITDKNNVINTNERVNSITQSENIDESNLKTVNIHNNKSHILKSIPTAPESLTTYTTEQYKNAITILNDSTISQTLVTPFSSLHTIATNTGANTTAEFAEKEIPLIFPETSTSNTKSSSKTKNDHHGVLKTMQKDAENAKKIYSYTNDSLITEPVTSLIDVDSKFSQQDTTNYTPFLDNKNTKMTIDLNNTGTKHIQATTDQIRIGVTSANMQKYSETTIETINVIKSNANMDTGVSDPNTNSVNLSESPLTYNFIKMFSVSNLTSFQEPVTVKMEIKNVDIVDYQMPETTTGYLQVDSINESVNTNQSHLPSMTRFQINRENKETINNTQVTDPPTASYQFIIDKSSVDDIYAGVNNTYRRIHEKLAATSHHMQTDKKNISPILFNTGYNSDANSSILTNKIISETLHTITKLTDNIQTQTEKKSRAQSMRPNVSSIYKPEVQPTDNLKITAQAYEYHLKNKVQPNISLSTDLNDYTKDALKIRGTTQPTRETALTTNGTWNYPSAPQSFGNNITNSSYLYNNSQNKPLGNDSLISSKTNVGEQSTFIQINSTRSTINVKYRKSLQSIVAMNNGTTSKSSQQKSFSKNNTLEKNETHILQKPETIIHVQKLQFHCHNRSRGRYSDTEDCSIFYICIGKLEPIIGKCPARTVFSDIRKQCTKNMSHCIRQSKFKCTTAGRFSDILKPNTYYICVRRNISFVRYKFQCLNGYFLNKTLVKCMVDTEPESQRQTSVSYDSSKSDLSFNENSNTNKASSKIDSIKKSEKIFKCEKEGKFADKSDCRKYYLCTKNNKSEFRTRKKKCESDEVFHKDEKKCVDADSNEC